MIIHVETITSRLLSLGSLIKSIFNVFRAIIVMILKRVTQNQWSISKCNAAEPLTME